MNLLMTAENYTHKRGLVIKLNLEKTSGKVDWEFLDAILRVKGFGQLRRKCIYGCLSSANYLILINGRPRGKIIPT